MGYYTTYRLEWEPRLEEVEIFLDANHDIYYGIDETGASADSVKWYDHEEDMTRLSLAFPKVTFTLYGEGEENGDLWIKRFVNGEKQVAKAIITYPPFKD